VEYIIAAVVVIILYFYSMHQIKKMRDRNKPAASQFDGDISDYGVTFSMIHGSPHMYGNNIDKFGEYTQEIRSSGGGKK
jgi:hypothetical protein